MPDKTDTALHPFVRKVAHAMRRRCGVRRDTRLVLAVSGGPDSAALTAAVAALAPRRGWNLVPTVAHVQHHLRHNGEADRDADFVAALARRYRMPMRRADLDLSDCGGNLEAEARHHRYAALARIAAEVGADLVATAHHADDQLETLLMRLLRGASVKGLAAMAWRRPIVAKSGTALLRPMLAVDRAEVKAFLGDVGQDWREDRTNDDTSRLRARLRRQVMPALRDVDARAPSRAVRLADHLRQVDDLITLATDHAAQQTTHDDQGAVLDRGTARDLPRVVLAALLRRLLAEQGVAADRLGERCIGPLVRAIRDHKGGQRHFGVRPAVTVTVTRYGVRVKRESD
jgi:tRNA(Ile)-lysidine synthase